MSNVLRRFGLAAFAWALVAGACYAQCPGGLCPVTPWQSSPAAPPTAREVSVGPAIAAAVCRVVNAQASGSSVGSGSLIETPAGGALVLTCDHLFREGVGRVSVTFRGASPATAAVIVRDSAHDLALLRVASPSAQPLRVRTGPPAGHATACGLGGDGRLRAIRGRVVGRRTPAGAQYPSVLVAGAVRSGDSGGPLLNDSGEVVGVVWGVAGNVTYATAGAPLARLLQRAPSRREPGASPAPPAREEIAGGCRCDGRCATKEELEGFVSQSELAARLERFDRSQSRLSASVQQLDARLSAAGPAPSEQERGNDLVSSLLGFAIAGVGVGSPIGLALLIARFAWRRHARRRRGPGGPRTPAFR